MVKTSRKRISLTSIIFSALALLIAVLLGYSIYMVIVSNRSTLVTAVVENTTVRDGITAEGILIRDEELVYKESGRYYATTLTSGQRVSAGNSIAVSFSSQSNLSRYRAMCSAQKRLGMYESITAAESTPDLLPQLNSKIYEALRGCALYSEPGLYQTGMAASYGQLGTLTLQRTAALDESIDLEEAIRSAKSLIEELDSAISADQQPLTANRAGYYVNSADGYEQVLTTSDLDTLSAEALRKKMEFPASAITSKTVLGKLVRGYTWYVALFFTPEEARMLNEGETYTLLIAGDSVTATAYHVDTNEYDGNVLVVMQCDVPLSDMGISREQNCTVVLASYSGFKIPMEGLRVKDEQPGVYVLEGAKAVFKPVKLLYTGDSFYIVQASAEDTKQLFLYDTVILGRNDLYDGKIVK